MMYQRNDRYFYHVFSFWLYKIIIFSFFVLFSFKIFSNEEEYEFQFNRGFTDITCWHKGYNDLINFDIEILKNIIEENSDLFFCLTL
jgi:hypothetical protein